MKSIVWFVLVVAAVLAAGYKAEAAPIETPIEEGTEACLQPRNKALGKKAAGKTTPSTVTATAGTLVAQGVPVRVLPRVLPVPKSQPLPSVPPGIRTDCLQRPDPREPDKAPDKTKKLVVRDYKIDLELIDLGNYQTDGDGVRIDIWNKDNFLSTPSGFAGVSINSATAGRQVPLSAIKNEVCVVGVAGGAYPPATASYVVKNSGLTQGILEWMDA